jgi:hypothetical protein
VHETWLLPLKSVYDAPEFAIEIAVRAPAIDNVASYRGRVSRTPLHESGACVAQRTSIVVVLSQLVLLDRPMKPSSYRPSRKHRAKFAITTRVA